MSRQAGGRPLRSDARANREALLAAARRLYAERAGAVAFTMVAQEAGVGVATLYRNFPTQEDLVVGVLAQVRDEVVARDLPGRARRDGRGPRGSVDAVRHAYR